MYSKTSTLRGITTNRTTTQEKTNTHQSYDALRGCLFPTITTLKKTHDNHREQQRLLVSFSHSYPLTTERNDSAEMPRGVFKKTEIFGDRMNSVRAPNSRRFCFLPSIFRIRRATHVRLIVNGLVRDGIEVIFVPPHHPSQLHINPSHHHYYCHSLASFTLKAKIMSTRIVGYSSRLPTRKIRPKWKHVSLVLVVLAQIVFIDTIEPPWHPIHNRRNLAWHI